MLEFEGRELALVAAAKEAEVYTWADDKVVRLLRNPGGLPQIEREAMAMRAVAALGGPAPVPFETTIVHGRPGLVMERLEGPDLASLVRRQPWRAATFGRMLAETHVSLHTFAAPEELEPLREKLRRDIDSAPALRADLRAMALETLAELPDGESVCHGDFHPANVIVDHRRGPMVIDWPNAARGDHHGDVARTLLLLAYAGGPSIPLPLKPLLSAVRGRLSLAYLAIYRSRRELHMDTVRRWQVAWAARRFSEGLPGEHRAMEQVIRRGGLSS
jgi:Ser/Thr protein kinase RdoA (MazF antagonist)